jgi:hypothetical protein
MVDGIMKKMEKRVLGSYILLLLAIVAMTHITGCDSGWSIAGWEVK